MKKFDHKFGVDFLNCVSNRPGIYKIYDSTSLIYVGKAKNLMRRLGQYRNAKRLKAHLKMRSIIEASEKIELELCDSELEALLLETTLIQTFRPRFNVAGAFHFLYPMIGIYIDGENFYIAYTTDCSSLPQFTFHGAFRSRYHTKEAFFALRDLLGYVGHLNSKKQMKLPVPPFSYIYGFRKLPFEKHAWDCFFKGESKALLEELVLCLVENATARKDPSLILKELNKIKRFWKHEILPLKKVRLMTKHPTTLVAQEERDALFLRFRAEQR